MYSYHIFYHPFTWDVPESTHLPFDQQVDLKKIAFSADSNWERISLPKGKTESSVVNSKSVQKELEELYNEKNYYYRFVHPILYDMDIAEDLIYHFERKEPKNSKVFYCIQLKEKTYQLRVEAININLYATGVGVMSFFLCNEEPGQADPRDILNINQFGRRIMPAFFADKQIRVQIADSIYISGLNGDPDCYREDFNNYKLDDTWEAARFITSLIEDLSATLQTTPVIDDRMYVNCWFGNDEMKEKFAQQNAGAHQEFIEGNFWYKYVFLDNDGDTCQNAQMKSSLLEDATYLRWQKSGTLYGISRYSFVALTDIGQATGIIPVHLRTIYSRMVELCLVQRASVLRFSAEVTNLSHLKNERKDRLSAKISAMYKLYIRFVNQIFFREITAQDQGIELYRMFLKNMDIDKHVKDLDSEIEELHRYVTFTEEHSMNKQMTYLTLIATIFLPISLVTGFFGMNTINSLYSEYCPYSLHWQSGIILLSLIIAWLTVLLLKKKYK